MKDSSISSFRNTGIKYILRIIEEYSSTKTANCTNTYEFLKELGEQIKKVESLRVYEYTILKNKINKGENFNQKRLETYYKLEQLIQKII